MTDRTHEASRHQVGFGHKRRTGAARADMGGRAALLWLSLCSVLLGARVGTGGQILDLTDPGGHARYVERLTAESRARKAEAILWAEPRHFPVRDEDPRRIRELMALLDGRPLYYATTNVEAALSIATDMVRNVAPWDLDGDGIAVGVWDSAGVLASHQEFLSPEGGSRVAVRDSLSSSGHATHVAGTIAAAGVDPLAKGMAPRARIESYNWNDDTAQMASRAARFPDEPGKIFVSNHSYGFVAGWEYIGYDTFSGHVGWHWFGDWAGADSREDWFGQYTSIARQWDDTAVLHPYYLAFAAAGNDRSDNPEPGQTVYYWQSTWVPIVYSSDTCPPGDGVFRNGYDTISGAAVAKNVMTVGAVDEAMARGARGLANATMAPFSSWGPTDDGRIKPDIVANGIAVYSTANASDHDYETSDGTSMACPGATGSAALLVQQYRRLFPGQAMRASTLKGLIIHTADDLGRPGPDYQYGWGLMNTRAAAELIKKHAEDPSGNCIFEGLLDTSRRAATHYFQSDGIEPIRVTLCWTAPIRQSGRIHDLDLRINSPDGSTTYRPYVLSPSHPEAVASTGDNNRDNVEQIYLGTLPQSGLYKVQIGFASNMSVAEQHYSLISSIPLYGHGPTPPTAQSIRLYSALNAPATIFFEATDDGLPDPPGYLTYTISSLPSHGTLEFPDGTVIAEPMPLVAGLSQVVYVPDNDFAGNDQFTFFADDGGQAPSGGPSNTATVTIAVRDIMTREYQVGASEDDVSEFGGFLGRYLWVGQNSSAVRFRNVDIPAGSEIVRAHLKLARDSWRVEERIDATVYAEATGHAEDFAAANRRIADLPRTEAGVPWIWEVGNYPYATHNSSPDISPLIQEIVERPDWSQGNALALLYIGNNIGGTEIDFYSWDRDPALAAKLEVTFGLPVEGTPVPPIAEDAETTAVASASTTIQLGATDDGLPDPPGRLAYTIASEPGHGTLTYPDGTEISPPAILADFGNEVVYHPDEGFIGEDAFTFYADDGGTAPSGGVSNTATVTIIVAHSATETVTRVFHVLAPEDDARGSQAEASAFSSTLDFGPEGSGLRFRNIDVPNGSVIVGARLKLCMRATRIEQRVEGLIQAEATGDALDFAPGKPSIGDRARTEASSPWTWEAGPIEAETWYTGGDIAEVIQEVVGREDWWTGHSLALFCSGDNPELQFHACAYQYSDLAARLQITYVPNPDPNVVRPEPTGEPPTARDMEAETPFNTPVTITLEASDDGLPDPPGALSYTIASLPGHGTLEHPGGAAIDQAPTPVNLGHQVVYRPHLEFSGSDSFTFYADDGGTSPSGGASNIATVTITVTATPPASPMAYWPFDEGEGKTVYDTVGGRHGRVTGAQWTDGQVGGALSFNGQSNYVALPDNDPVWLPQGDFSIAFWVYFEARPAWSDDVIEVVLDLNYAASQNAYNELGYAVYRDVESGTMVFGMITSARSSEDLFSDTQLVNDRWYHVVAVRNGASQQIYVDGELDNDRTCSRTPITFTGTYDDNKVNIGRYTIIMASPTQFYFKGKLDEVMIFDQALTPAEIRRIHDEATVTLAAPPTAEDIQVATAPDTPVGVIFQAQDDGLPDPPGRLSYVIASLPSHGTLAYPDGTPIVESDKLAAYDSEVVYRPNAGFDGEDTFTYRADDGGTSPTGGFSNVATVQILVAAPLLHGLVGRWHFDESQGDTTQDSVGSRHAGIRGAQWTSGKYGSALSFDGSFDYVALPANVPIWLPTSDFTIAFWVNFSADATFLLERETILDLNRGWSSIPGNRLGCCLFRYPGNSKIVFVMTTTEDTDDELLTQTSFDRNTWYHVTAVRRGTSQEMYVNGELERTRACSRFPIDFDGSYDDDLVNVGRYSSSAGSPRYYFSGKLDEITIFERALGDDEIRLLYSTGASFQD